MAESNTTSMNVSLPKEMKEWVENHVQDGGEYTNSSDLIRDLIRQKQREEMLKIAIQQGLDSGDAGELDMNEIEVEARRLSGLD